MLSKAENPFIAKSRKSGIECTQHDNLIASKGKKMEIFQLKSCQLIHRKKCVAHESFRMA